MTAALPAGGLRRVPGGRRMTLLPGAAPCPPAPSEGENFGENTQFLSGKPPRNFSRRRDAIVLNCDKIDGAHVRGPFAIRGQRLTLPGSRGGRSVKRLLADRGFLPERGERIPVLCVGDPRRRPVGRGHGC